MGSAVEQLTNNYQTSTPVSFYDYYNAYGQDRYGAKNWTKVDPNSFGGRFQNFMSGTGSSAKQQYEQYLAEYEYQRNLKAPQNDVQKAVADIKAAGLNPWLALNGGSMSSAVTASQSASARYEVRDKQLKGDKSGKASSLLGSALKILIMAAIMS